MLYRRKIILNLLRVLGGNVDKVSFMKLLFLLNTEGGLSYYDFVPYKQGCFSFTAYSDLNCMGNDGLVSFKSGPHNIILLKFDENNHKIKSKDNAAISFLLSRFRSYSKEDLIRYTYNTFPFYASKSILKDFLTPSIKNNISKIFDSNNRTVLYTIGYEGKSVESYFNALLLKNIKVLIDVRKNPISMKYGFSKPVLSTYANDLGILYMHFPELGVESDKRKNLSDIKSYNNLFDDYEKTVLPVRKEILNKILHILKINKKIALTCFEADSNFCHRKRIAQHIATLPGWDFTMEHL